MSDVWWLMEDGRRKMYDGWCMMSDVWCMTSEVWWHLWSLSRWELRVFVINGSRFQVPGFRFQVSSALSLRFFVFVVHGSKIQNSLHAYMILLKLPMNKRIDAFASLHKAYMEPTWCLHANGLIRDFRKLACLFAKSLLNVRSEIL